MAQLRSKLLKENNDEIPPLTATEVLTILKKIDTTPSRYSTRDKAILAFLYLSGCRISEVVKCQDKKALAQRTTPLDHIGNLPIPYLRPISKSDIEWYDDGFDIHHVRTLKRRGNKLVTRDIPVIPVTQDEKELLEYFKTYYNNLPDLTEQEQEDGTKFASTPIFNLTRQRVWKILNGRSDIFPHLMRHSSASRDSRIGFNNAELRKRYGWTDERTPGIYTKSNIEDLKEKYRKARR